jgi:hypothetical protein
MENGVVAVPSRPVRISRQADYASLHSGRFGGKQTPSPVAGGWGREQQIVPLQARADESSHFFVTVL